LLYEGDSVSFTKPELGKLPGLLVGVESPVEGGAW
jgi:hypothetical protein